MNKTVWKYELLAIDMQGVSMPIGAEVLCVQAQNDVPCLWARVDPEASNESRLFRVAGTGHPDVEGTYIGTFQLHKGALVFHVFEIQP